MSIFSSIKEKITDYIDVNVKLIKLNFISRTSGILSYLMYLMIVLFLTFCILLLLGFGLTELFMTLGLSRLAAIFMTIGTYVLMLLIVSWQRRNITRFFAGSIINVLTEEDDDDDDDDEKRK